MHVQYCEQEKRARNDRKDSKNKTKNSRSFSAENDSESDFRNDSRSSDDDLSPRDSPDHDEDSGEFIDCNTIKNNIANSIPDDPHHFDIMTPENFQIESTVDPFQCYMSNILEIHEQGDFNHNTMELNSLTISNNVNVDPQLKPIGTY